MVGREAGGEGSNMFRPDAAAPADDVCAFSMPVLGEVAVAVWGQCAIQRGYALIGTIAFAIMVIMGKAIGVDTKTQGRISLVCCDGLPGCMKGRCHDAGVATVEQQSIQFQLQSGFYGIFQKIA